MGEKGKKARDEMRTVFESVGTRILEDINNTTFPYYVIDELKKYKLNGFLIKDFGGLGLTNMETAAVTYEMAKRD